MILSTDPKFLFIHIPKTAGTSIEECLYHFQDFKYHHMVHGCALQFKQYLNKGLFDELFKFSFIRNPWDLQVSCWRYYVRNHGVNMDFNEYIQWKFTGNIEDMKDRLPKNDSQINLTLLRNGFSIHRTPMTYFLIDEQGNFLVDYIGNVENLQKHYDIISEKLKIETCILPHTNTSTLEIDHLDYKKYYDKNSIELVRSRFALDIHLFGYSFENGLPNQDNFGFISEKNNSLEKRSYKLPTDFYFSMGDIPYGLGEIEYRYNSANYENEFKNFQINKSQRRLVNLKNNVRIIQENIQKMVSEISNHPQDYSIYNTHSIEIKKLQERVSIYEIEINKIEKIIEKS